MKPLFKIPKIEPLRSLSPSRYTRLCACPLREILAAGMFPPLLPSSPKAVLGIIAHKLLEEATKGMFSDPQQANMRFDSLVAEWDERLGQTSLQRHFVPLNQTCVDFHVFRLRVTKAAKRIISSSFGHIKTEKQHKVELELSSIDGTLHGRIDDVQEINGQLILRDHKSGLLFEDDESGSLQIRHEYVVQMHLYAALYAEQYHKWPDKLVLVALNGEETHIPFTPEECARLRVETSKTLQRVNEDIRRVLAGSAEISILADSKPDICHFCQYRPACPAYFAQRNGNTEAAWPNDICGQLISLTAAGSGMRHLTLDVGGVVIAVRRLSDVIRHPALDCIKVGAIVSGFNLRKNIGTNLFAEGPLTMFYSKDTKWVPDNKWTFAS